MLFRVFTLVAVVALAISTWILSSPAHRPRAAPRAGEADLPGYYLKNAVLTDYDAAGHPSIRLEADRIDQIAHGTEVQLSKVRVNYQTANGQDWVLTGDIGHVEPGGSVIDVTQNVMLTGESTERAGTIVVHSDALSYDVPEAVVSTTSDVRIDFGPRSVTARGLIVNLKERTIHLESKVNGHFQR